jgi:hypothetical protein
MNRDYLQLALGKFNVGKHQWYGWKKDFAGDVRMAYENIILNDDTATIPSEADVNAKIKEIKDAEADAIAKKASGKQKLLDLGLSEEEVKALIGV